ncbi:MAG TPA: hypothetical protein VIM98_01785 [Dyella sp.]|uniref:hypothetical protein n=1 Tax=Dyella sp. TaxID=1869338 RepID=UPI002F91C4F6
MLNRPRTRIPREALRQGLLDLLPPLVIPDAKPVPFGGASTTLYAIGLSAINSDLSVFVPPYGGMNPGDYIEVFWDNSGIPIASTTVNDNNKDKYVGLPLPYSSFANGRFTPYYRVRRISDLLLFSETRDIWVKLNRPGDFDPNPFTPEQEYLLAPILPEDVRDGLDDNRAALGVDVTIPPYPNMADYDRIDFSWGGSGDGIRRVYTVQPDEVGQPIVLHMTEAEILGAGDGEVLLMYTVIDAAYNRTADAKWSMVTRLDVLANNSPLDAPYVIEVDENDVIDLAVLGGANATAMIYTISGSLFAVNDTIEFTWAGIDSHGAALTPYTDSQTIRRVPGPLIFIVPNAIVVASAGGRAILSYVLRKQNGDAIDSRHSTVRIAGQAAPDLPPPIVTPSLLPADIAHAEVTVPAYPGMGEGDRVTLIWAGTDRNGQPTDYRTTFDVTQAWVGQDLPFPIDGPEHIAPLAGGSATVYYEIDYAAGPALVRESERLELPIGDAANQLPAPTVIEAPDGIFDPALTLANVRIPGTTLVANDRIDLTWVGDITGTYTDNATVRTTGQAANFAVPAARIAGNRQITIHYTVNGSLPSTSLTLRVAASGDLPIPEVDQANNGVLTLADIPAGGAIGRVRPYSGIGLNDEVTLYLEQPAGTVRWQLMETVTDTTQDLTFTIPRSIMVGLVNRTIQLRYTVQFAHGGSDGQSAVAHFSVEDGANEQPVIESVRDALGREIPNGSTTGATTLTLSGTAARNERVQLFDGNVSLGIVDVSASGRWSLTVAGLGSGVHAFTAEGLYDNFPVSAPYGLRIALSGRLLVMGGRSASRWRYRKGVNGTLNQYRRLHALDATTKTSIPARWRYAHEAPTASVTVTDFPDSNPDAVLYIDTDDDQVILRPRNILGNGYSDEGTPGGAFVAWRDQGNLAAWGSPTTGGSLVGTIPGFTDILQVETNAHAFAARRGNEINSTVVAWGVAASGGNLPEDIAEMTDIVEVIGSMSAFAARRRTGQVVVWGSTGSGGRFPEGSPIPGMTDIIEVVSGYEAFAARRSNGRVVAWGAANRGGTVPEHIADLDDIVEVIPAYYAFAARRENGKIVAWGSSSQGGEIPDDIAELDDIVELLSNAWAFAGRRENGKVVAWGANGGSVPDDIAELDDIVALSSNGFMSFAALRKNGKVVTWPGTLPEYMEGLDDIVELVGNYFGFAARRANGQVAAWGGGNIGTVPKDIAELADIVDVVPNAHAFAALRSNGEVVAWGTSTMGGQIPDSTKPLLTNVRAIYANICAFAALTDDNRVVVWGHGSWGGANSNIPSHINGNISYELKAAVAQGHSPSAGKSKAPRKRRHKKNV